MPANANRDGSAARKSGSKRHGLAWRSFRKTLPWAAGALAAGVAFALWQFSTRPSLSGATAHAAGVKGNESSQAVPSSPAYPVSVAEVRRQDVRVTVNAIGNIAAANTAVVHAKVDGELKALHFTEGQFVRAGQLLAEIDPRSFQIALAQAQGTLARDQAQLRNAKLDLDRFHNLLSKDAIARQQVDTQEALVLQLQGAVQSDQAQVDNAKLQLSYTRVVAPISGFIGLKQVDLGNNVRASDANGLVSIAQTQPVNVVFTVSDAYLPKIRSRLKAGEDLHVEAWDREQKNVLAEGKITTIDNAIDPATGTIKLKASFPNVDGSLFPNQFVNVRLQLDTLENALVVPSSALMRSPKGSYVYLVNNGSVTIQGLLAGESDGNWVSIRGRLKPGDKVVTDGTDRLRDGAKVEIVAQTAMPALAPSGASTDGRNASATPKSDVTGTAGMTPVAHAPDAANADPSRHGDDKAAAKAPAVTTKQEPVKTRATVAQNAAAKHTAAAPSAGPGATDALPSRASTTVAHEAWIDRLPPDVAAKVMKMRPEQRRAWIGQRLDDRAREAAAIPPGGARPAWVERLPPDVAEKVMKMSSEERYAWVRKRLEERLFGPSGGTAGE
jgi:multidrug efflux system membrane fusion protein